MDPLASLTSTTDKPSEDLANDFQKKEIEENLMADEELNLLKEEDDNQVLTAQVKQIDESYKNNNDNYDKNQQFQPNEKEGQKKNSPDDSNDDAGSVQAVPPFLVSKRLLLKIFQTYQGRTQQEDVELLEKQGGISWLENGLQTNLKNGIQGDEKDLQCRYNAFGSNKRDDVQEIGFFSFLCEALDDFTLKLLLVASILSIIIKTWTAPNEATRSISWIEGFAIFVAVCLCAIITAINNYQKEKQFQQLNQVANLKKIVSVVRNGSIIDIHQSEIVVGDIVIIREGMGVPADGILIEGNEVQTDESAMTGETESMHKDTLSNIMKQQQQLKIHNQMSRHDAVSPILMSGTQIMTGEGKMLILVVGYSSCIGKIQLLLKSQEEEEQTPLQKKLEKLATQLSVRGLICSCLSVFSLLVRFSIEQTMEGSWGDLNRLNSILDYIIIGIALLVMAIPEGLPLSVTISLAYSIKRMIQDQILVRKLQACETMGNANIICSDKTGTLTMNQMTFVEFWNEKYFEINPYLQEQNLSSIIPDQARDLFLQSIVCNSSARIYPSEKGSCTEIALLKFIQKTHIDIEEYRNKFEIVTKIPFNSMRKRMSSILKTQEGLVLHVKGASEFIVENCTHYHNLQTNEIVPIDEQLQNQLHTAIDGLTKQALRSICIAYKKIENNENLEQKDQWGVYEFEKCNLTIIGFIGIKDIIRPEVPPAVIKCQNAGIRVIMITGDNKKTAENIAKECNIISPSDQEYIVMDGPEFQNRTGGVVCKNCQTNKCGCPIDDQTAKQLNKKLRIDTIKNTEEFDRLIPLLRVLARSRPEDKYALVTGLLERGNVVAVTGDGTNDAPALKKADVGLAMGISGTEVAREASSIILLDDNFKSIVQAVLWGRNIYDSISKFLQFQLNVTVVAIFTTIVTSIIIQTETLKPIQILWVNLIQDSLAALALATEKPYEELLNRKPKSRNDSIVTCKMIKHVLGQGIFQSILILIFIFQGQNFLPEFGDKFDKILLEKCRAADGTYNCLNSAATDWFLPVEQRYPNWWQYKYNEEPKSSVALTDQNIEEYISNLKGHICSGIPQSIDMMTEKYILVYLEFTVPSRHFTYIFNLFVFQQLFNFLNVRKLNDEINIFSRIFDNYLFLMILGIILICQMFIITFGGIIFNVYPYYGLTVQQWLITILYSSLVLIVGLILRLSPDCGKKQEPQQNDLKYDNQLQQEELVVKEKKNE